jgi:Zn-dependent peptidase ImmA (M78 family)/transcriptional regulator with XRE-family HTH domain
MHFGERIRQAREIRAWTQDELADKIGKSKSLVAQVEGGFRLPSDEMLDAVSFATKFPLAFFNAAPHQEFPISEVIFRAPKSIKRREVLDAVRYAEHVFSIYTTVSQKLKEVPALIPETTARPAEAARTVKQALGIDAVSPMTNLIRPLERAGVAFIVLPKAESREAFSVWLDRRDGRCVPIVAYSVDEGSVDRTRLSIAHEIGHITMHKSFLRKAHDEVEAEAFAFGAEWLMPEAAMRREIQDPVTITSLAKLKPRWGVSIASLITRAFDLSLISKRQYHYLFHQLSALGMKTREPQALDIPMERPRLLRKMIEIVYGNPIDYPALCKDTQVSAQEIRRVLMDYEGAAGEKTVPKSNVIKFAKRASVHEWPGLEADSDLA